MTYEIVIGALGFIVALIAVVKPIMDLNTNITALNISLRNLEGVLKEIKDRVDHHGDEIDSINIKVTDHEARIKNLEEK